MRTKNNILNFFLNCAFIIVFVGCKKEVQVGAPITQLVTTSVFADNSTATAAQLSIYAQLIDWPWYLHQTTALSSDELTSYATDQYSRDLYTNGLNALSDASSIPMWGTLYPYLYQANAVLENLQISTGVDPKVKSQLNGEALFMRAYFYFYLVNLYGDVPLVTSTNYKVNATLSRTPKSQVYQQIVNDLKKAQASLNSNFVDASDTAISTDHIRPTSVAATALLARVYLYTGDWVNSEAMATSVINNPSFNLPADLTQVFLMNSSEAIWQLGVSSAVFWTTDGNNFILTSPPSPSTSNNSTTISPQLLAAFENGDLRKSTWINTYSNGSETWSFPYKYRDNYNATGLNEYTMMLRLAEQFLIRSEARIQQGNTVGALADLNTIRNRANLPNYSGATDKASVLGAIAHERQVELFTEADRWIDLKRTQTVDAVMGGPSGACAAKGGNWDTRQQLYPINVSDVKNNSNISQNPGYN